MSQLGQAVFSICISAFICCLIHSLLPQKGPLRNIGNMLCGIFMLCSILFPLRRLDFDFTDSMYDAYLKDAQTLTSNAEESVKNELQEVISQQVSAYILDKAAEFHAELDVSVVLSGDAVPMPVGVIISGNISPYGKTQLQNIIVSELGIPKEDQQWI